MAWIESHQELAHHPKVARLAHTLDVSVPAAIGHLHLFWWWCLAYADDGNVAGFDAFEIAYGAKWKGNSELFVEALTECGWVDNGEVHDWHEYAGKLVERRRADAERKRQARSQTSTGRPTDTTKKPSDLGEQSTGRPKDGSKDGVRTNQPTNPTNLTFEDFHRTRAEVASKATTIRFPSRYKSKLMTDEDFLNESEHLWVHRDCGECGGGGFVEVYSPGSGGKRIKCEAQ